MRVAIDGKQVKLGQCRNDLNGVVVSRKHVEKSAVPPAELDAIWKEALQWNFFAAGDVPQNLVCNTDLTDAEIKTLLGWFSKLADAVRRCGVRAKA